MMMMKTMEKMKEEEEKKNAPGVIHPFSTRQVLGDGFPENGHKFTLICPFDPYTGPYYNKDGALLREEHSFSL